MRKKSVTVLAALLAASSMLGCSRDKDKGINKDKDRPRIENKSK